MCVSIFSGKDPITKIETLFLWNDSVGAHKWPLNQIEIDNTWPFVSNSVRIVLNCEFIHECAYVCVFCGANLNGKSTHNNNIQHLNVDYMYICTYFHFQFHFHHPIVPIYTYVYISSSECEPFFFLHSSPRCLFKITAINLFSGFFY